MKKLTIEERIDKYMQKYPYPLERLYPTVIINWQAYGKKYYYNFKTGKISNLYPKDFAYRYRYGKFDEHGRIVDSEDKHLYIPGKRTADKILIPANIPGDFGYVHYSKIYHLFEICQIRFDTKRNYEGKIKTPSVICRTFITEENLHDIYDEHGCLINRKEWYNTFKHLNTSCTCWKEIKKAIGNIYLDGRLVHCSYANFIYWIYAKSNFKITKSYLMFKELSKEIEEESITINKIKKSNLIVDASQFFYWAQNLVNIIFGQTSSGISYARYFVLIKNNIYESIRVFFLSNHKIICGKKWKGTDFKIGHFQNLSGSIVDPDNFITFEENFKDFIIRSMIKNINGYRAIINFPLIYKYPVSEKLLNAGYIKEYNKIVSRATNHLPINIYGKLNKGTKLYAILGCTKQQLQQSTFNYEIATLKKFLETTDIRPYGIEPIKNIIRIQSFGYCSFFSYEENIFKIISIPQKLKILKTLAQFEESYCISLFTDILRCLRTVLQITEDENEVKSLKFWRFNSKKDLEDLHDKAIKMQNRAYKKQREMKSQKLLNKYKMTKKKRDELYDFEDDEFIIKMPDTPIDIMEEGKALDHCVGGYMENHVDGKTTILFLRRKNDPETSFYTIEVKDNKVIQIHGKYNRWLGNNPEAIPFMRKWLLKTGVNCTERILRLNATGYAGVGQLVDA